MKPFHCVSNYRRVKTAHTAGRLAAVTLAAGLFATIIAPVKLAFASAPPSAQSTAVGTVQTFVLDGVSLTITTRDPLPAFTVADPANANQTASASLFHPFRDVMVMSIPFGTQPPTEPVGAAGPGEAAAYLAALQTYRVDHQAAAATFAAPPADIFGGQAAGEQWRVLLPVDGKSPVAVDVVDWVAEAGSRLWIVEVSAEVRADMLADAEYLVNTEVHAPRAGPPQ